MRRWRTAPRCGGAWRKTSRGRARFRRLLQKRYKIRSNRTSPPRDLPRRELETEAGGRHSRATAMTPDTPVPGPEARTPARRWPRARSDARPTSALALLLDRATALFVNKTFVCARGPRRAARARAPRAHAARDPDRARAGESLIVYARARRTALRRPGASSFLRARIAGPCPLLRGMYGLRMGSTAGPVWRAAAEDPDAMAETLAERGRADLGHVGRDEP